MESLDTFLESQQSGLFDSSGEFTIAADKALEKLARSQLPEPSYWILKLAQFATCFGVERVSVAIRKGHCRVFMTLPKPLGLEHISRGLGSVEPLCDPALEHLVTGLRAIGGMTERRFGLCLRGPDHCDYLRWTGSELSSSRGGSDSERNELMLEVALAKGTVVQNVASLIGTVLREGESEVLMESAYTVPYQLSLGGYKIHQFRRDTVNLFFQTIFWDYHRCEDGVELPAFLRKQGREYPRVSAYWRATYYYEVRHEARTLYPSPKPLFHSSTIFWLRDGVIVKKELLKGPGSPYAVEVYVDCSELPTDLGGLDCRRGPEFEEKREWVRRLLAHIAKKAPSHVENFKKVSGTSLSRWEANFVATKFLPLVSEISYSSRTKVAQQLNALPAFRKKLVQQIRSGTVPFNSLQLPSLM